MYYMPAIKIMKTKQMVTVALITVLIAMTSCGNNNKQNQNAQTGQQTTTMALNIENIIAEIKEALKLLLK